MKERTENTISESKNYTYVSMETLRNAFPMQAPTESLGHKKIRRSNSRLTDSAKIRAKSTGGV